MATKKTDKRLVLQTLDGRIAFVARAKYNHSTCTCDGNQLHAWNPVTAEWGGVDEAVIVEGDEKTQFEKIFADYCVKHPETPDFKFDFRKYGIYPVCDDGRSTYSYRTSDAISYELKNGQRKSYKRIGESWECQTEVTKMLKEVTCDGDFGYDSASVSVFGTVTEVKELFTFIGEGKVITMSSLTEARAKDDKTPKYWIGDQVTWQNGKETYSGIVTAYRKGITTVEGPNGKKTVVHVKPVKAVGSVVTSAVEGINPELKRPFDEVLERAKLYRGQIQRMDVDRPFMSGENIQRNAVCVPCPNCASPMIDGGHYRQDNVFTCVMCSQQARVVERNEEVVTLMLTPAPRTNQFCPTEARCCSNCGNFEFSTGRQGKRSTGYCAYSNQCMQAYHVCDSWYPRDSDRFRSNMRQNITNLKFGIKDSRNLRRTEGNIDNFVYTEDTHKEQVRKAREMEQQYVMLLADLRERLVAKAKDVEVKTW